MTKFESLCASLESKIQGAYESGTTMEEAEKLAAEFLYAQLQVSSELKRIDLSARMRKSGVKAVRAAVYLDKRQVSEGKPPTEAALAAMVDSDTLVTGEQDGLDKAEVDRDSLERFYSIFSNAHIYFRGIAKGNFGG